MIVMKFGGSSLASRSSIKRAAAIVRGQLHRAPVVVVSAIGDTTDQLLQVLACASRGNAYLSWKAQEELRTYHFCLAEDLLGEDEIQPIDSYLRQTFRELHVRMLEVCEGERSVTPELRDWVVSLGEQLSSRIVASAFASLGIDTVHMDARKLILTDDRFTNAEPRQWETYAKIRWAVPVEAKQRVVVLGGFIGATDDGRTTTLGRGGSDLTASLVGAAINAEEIQVWKDVDGLLTWDPRIKTGGYRVKHVSYAEMSDLARAGTPVLHPESVAPAQRLRIPITIRNTFHPECEGTQVGVPMPGAAVKSIACRRNVTLLELRSPADDVTGDRLLSQLKEFRNTRNSAASLVGMSKGVLHVAVEGDLQAIKPGFTFDGCVEAHIRRRQAIVTLVGAGIAQSTAIRELPAALTPLGAVMLPGIPGSASVVIAVPTDTLLASLELLRCIFFANCDPQDFATVEASEAANTVQNDHVASLVSPAGPPLLGKRGNLAFPGAPARA